MQEPPRSGKVVHLSSVHNVSDTRVFHKECRTLVSAGYKVTLVVNADDDTDWHGVRIRAIRQGRRGRLGRMTRAVYEVFRLAREQDGDLYHFHDPELMPVGIALKVLGKRVIYDAHEHVAKQILTKSWVPKYFRRPLSLVYRCFERVVARLVLDAVVVADPSQVDLYPSNKAIVVENFPKLSEFPGNAPMPYQSREARISYVGGLTELRGLKEMVESVRIVNESQQAALSLGGRFAPAKLEKSAKALPGWENVDYRGFLTRAEVFSMLKESRIGIVVLHPIPNYLTSQPVKLLEYMMAGLPVVVCDFPYYRQYVLDAECGIMVDPLDPQNIADAILWLLDHPVEAEQMGQRGRQAVLERYNWDNEAKTLLDLYQRLVPNSSLPNTVI